MFKKILRGSFFLSLMLIISITLTGCSLDLGKIFSGLTNILGSIIKGVGTVIKAVVGVVQGVVNAVTSITNEISNAMGSSGNSSGTASGTSNISSNNNKTASGTAKIASNTSPLSSIAGFGTQLENIGDSLIKAGQDSAGNKVASGTATTQTTASSKSDSNTSGTSTTKSSNKASSVSSSQKSSSSNSSSNKTSSSSKSTSSKSTSSSSKSSSKTTTSSSSNSNPVLNIAQNLTKKDNNSAQVSTSNNLKLLSKEEIKQAEKTISNTVDHMGDALGTFEKILDKTPTNNDNDKKIKEDALKEIENIKKKFKEIKANPTSKESQAKYAEVSKQMNELNNNMQKFTAYVQTIKNVFDDFTKTVNETISSIDTCINKINNSK